LPPAWNARASYSPDAMELNDLYRDVILDHNRRPRNFGGLEPADASVEGFNPLCGDRLTVRLQMQDDKISDIRFEGQGCAISTASASMMTEAVKGKTRADALRLFDRVHQLLTDDGAPPAEELGKLAALSGVREYPARVKCASLCWHTLASALKSAHPQGLPPVTTE
jgi:nitrogen fixation NifU-like protein